MTGSRSLSQRRRQWTYDISEWTGMAINEAARVAEDRVNLPDNLPDESSPGETGSAS